MKTVQYKSKYKSSVIIFLGTILLGFYSCSSTKFVGENKHLLNKVVLKVDDKRIVQKKLRQNIKQVPNLKILGIWKFHMGLYNLSGRDENKGINRWLRRIGEKPVIYENFQTQRSLQQLQIYLRKKGWYNAVVRDSVSFRKKKAKLYYFVTAGKPYYIRNIYNKKETLPANFLSPFQYEQELDDSSKIKKIAIANNLRSEIRANKKVDSDILNKERTRISKMLKNKGYFNFSREYVHFVMDSNLQAHQMDIFVGIKKPENIKAYKKYRIRNTYIYTNYDPNTSMTNNRDYTEGLDTLFYKNVYFIYRDKLRINPEVILQSNFIRDSLYYNLNNVEKTYLRLQSLQQYKFIDIKFDEITSADTLKYGLLDCQIQLTPFLRQSYMVELEGTNASGNIGAAGNFNYEHKNLFKGAEIFNLRFTGTMETQKSVDHRDFNTEEVGGEASLKLPQFLLPFFRSEKFRKKYDPKTSLSLSYNFQRRPDYTRTIANASFGYFWNSTRFIKHTLTPAELNFVDVKNLSSRFIDSLRNLFIRNSFTDHTIFSSRYSFAYNNQNINRLESFHYLRFNFETAGNLLSTINRLTGRTRKTDFNDSGENEGKFYEFFRVRYAQYIRADVEYRFHQYINRSNTVVYRLFLGAGLPYGNLKVLPFEKSHFSGGANGIRAWQVRSLGPGSYVDNSDFPNSLADMKLEANLEYRFKLFWALEGALFLDAGNIWALSDKDDREGADFAFNRFYKEIALGTGFGVRVDLNFILFRLDLGFKLRDPSLPGGNRWIIGQKELFKFSDVTYNIGIGYPF